MLTICPILLFYNEKKYVSIWCSDVAFLFQNILKDLLDQFRLSLDQYQDLWYNLDEIDQETWILEPEKPTRADLHRRIALGVC
jgi:E3 ubiquitin-protein ligase FANCL